MVIVECYVMKRRITCCLVFCLFLVFTTTKAHNDSSSFELRNGFIIVTASLDGVTGSYILDSGAPGLVLNSSRFDLQGETVELGGVGGEMSGQIVSGHDFIWESVVISSLEAISIDLTYLESATGLPLAGLIGMDLFEGRDIMIDYARRQVFVSDQDCCGKADLSNFVPLPLVKNDHVLIVKMSYRGTELLFGIDTGSRSNIISKSAADKVFPEDYRRLDAIKLIGADQRETMTEEWLISAFRASDIDMDPIAFVIQDMDPIRKVQDISMDGILGHEFFQESQIMISGDRKYIYVKSSSIPLYVQR